MKYKYRLILRGDNKYCFQYKKQGLFDFLNPWIDHWCSDEDEEKVIKCMNEVIKEDNKNHNKKYFTILKEIDNE